MATDTLPPQTPAAPTATSPDPSRPTGMKFHRPECPCKMCLGIRNRIAAGLPTKEDARAIRKAQRIADRAARQREKEERQRRLAVAEGIATGRALSGQPPDISGSMELAGVKNGGNTHARVTANTKEGIDAALSRSGISDKKLATVLAEGLDATDAIPIKDHDGNVVDVLRPPDHNVRHKFLTTALTLKGYIGDPDANRVAGGLILMLPAAAENVRVAGHASTCQCQDCTERWQSAAREMMSGRMKSLAAAQDADLPSSTIMTTAPAPTFEDEDEGSTPPIIDVPEAGGPGEDGEEG